MGMSRHDLEAGDEDMIQGQAQKSYSMVFFELNRFKIEANHQFGQDLLPTPPPGIEIP